MSFSLMFAWRYLMGRKLRTFLTTLAVIFGVMVIFGLNGLIPALSESFRKNMMAAAYQVDLTVTSASRGVFSDAVLDTVRQDPDVASATGYLVRNISLPVGQGLKTKDGKDIQTLSVVGVDPTTFIQVSPLKIKGGRMLEAGDGAALMISTNLTQQTGLAVGDTLTLPSARGAEHFQIAGEFSPKTAPGATEEVYVLLTTAQAMFNQTGQVNVIDAMFVPEADKEITRSRVMADLGSSYKAGGIETGTELMAAIQMGQVIMNLFGVMALVMGGFIILNTFRTLVAERKRDIGMLRALGASRRTVLNLILVESLVQGVLGTALGLVSGYLLVKLILLVTAPVMEKKMNFPVGDPVFSPVMFAVAIALGIGITVAGGLFPALSASRLTPLDALRPAQADSENKMDRRRAIAGAILIAFAVLGLVSNNVGLASLGAVVFLVGLMLVAPALVNPIAKIFGRLLALIFAREGQIAQGNLARQPARAAITASVMTIGLAIVVAMAGMITTLFSGVFSYLDKSLGADYLVMPQSLMLSGGNVGAGPELSRSIAAAPGVEAVSSLRLGATQLDSTAIQVIGIDPEVYPKVSGLVFSSGSAEEAYPGLASGRTMIANGIFIAQTGAKVGQDLVLQTPSGPQTYRVVAVGLDYLNAKIPTAYISQANLEQDFHETSDVLLMVNTTDSADQAVVRTAIEAAVAPYAAFKLFSSEELRVDMTETASSALVMLYILMVTLAAPSLIALVNTLVINVLERIREIGMLRAVGATRRQVSRMILAESLLLSAMGTAFGILAGLWLGYVLIGAANQSGFVFTYSFPAAGILLTIAVGLLFGVIAALIPARHAAQLDIVTALQYE